MNQYTTVITSIACDQNNQQYPNLVVLIHFKVIGTSETGETVEYIGNITPPLPEGEFVQYEQLTEVQVVGWVETQADMQAIKDWIDQALNEAAPLITQLPVPWATVTAPTQTPQPMTVVFGEVTSVEI